MGTPEFGLWLFWSGVELELGREWEDRTFWEEPVPAPCRVERVEREIWHVRSVDRQAMMTESSATYIRTFNA